MPEVAVKMSGDEASLWQSMQKIIKAEKGMTDGLDKMKQQSKKAAAEQKALERAAKRVYESTRTPQEQHNQRLQKLDELLKRNKISQQTYTRAVTRAKIEHAASGAAGRQAAEEQAAAAKQALAAKRAEGEASKRAAAEQQALVSAAKRTYEETRTPQEQYNRRMRELNYLLKKNKIDQDTYSRAVRKAKADMQAAGAAGRQAFGPKALGMVRSLAGALGVGLGLGGMIRGVVDGLKNWREHLSGIASEARKAQDEMIVLAALQEGGKKKQRVMAAIELGARYGVSRGESVSTVQAMQSIHGSFQKGMQTSEPIFAAAQVGIRPELGRELEILGKSQGQARGQALRRAYASGQASGRDPSALSGAAAGFSEFRGEMDFGFAVGGVLSGTVSETRLRARLEAVAIALGQTSGAQEYFERTGLGEASKMERLQALFDRGITTVGPIKKIGIGKKERLFGLQELLTPENYAEINRVEAAIKANAKPGLFLTQRAEIEEEMPKARLTRQIRQLDVRYQNMKGLGPRAREALELDKTQAIRALALQSLGWGVSGLGTNLIEETEEGGRSTEWDMFVGTIGEGLNAVRESPWTYSGGKRHDFRRRVNRRMEMIREQIDAPQQMTETADKQAAAAEKQAAAAESIGRSAHTIARNTRRNPTLGRPDRDQ